MVLVTLSMHPRGLAPVEAAKAWYLKTQAKKSWSEIRSMTQNAQGKTPSVNACRNAVVRMKTAKARGKAVPATKYANCGRDPLLTADDERKVVDFVKKWRAKRFCVCSHIRAELKLKCSARTVGRCLNRHGYFWRAVAKKAPLKPQDIASRKAFVEKYGQHTPEWWENNLNLVLDGVTLTKAPQGLTGRKKHAAQSIGFMWMRQGERMDPKLHTYNRYGVQQGQKVPLWGGFTGGGRFTLRLWTARPKMTKEEWAKQIPALKRAVDEAGEMRDPNKKAKVWMDNERFLKNPGKYKAAGLLAINFPTNSGDINPIETVWAWLRRDLAKREFEDLKEDSVITASQFKQRAAQILQSYSVPETGEQYSKLSKLVRGMRNRLAKCKNNKFGPCGK